MLARWRDIDGTIVAPSRFIEIVERTGVSEVHFSVRDAEKVRRVRFKFLE